MFKWLKPVIKGNNPTTLIVVNTLLLVLVLASPLWVNFSWLGLFASFVMYFCMICLGVSTTYHRILTHKTVKLHPWVLKIFTTFACLAGTGSPIMWVMTHRQHHRFSDKEGDPHPPLSVPKTFFGIYPRVSAQGIRDVARDPYFRFWHKYYFGILYAWAAILGLISLDLLFYVAVLPVFLSVLVSNTLNWFGHSKSFISYRNFETPDKSQNNPILGWLIFGEGFHNNHHKYPGSANFGVKKGEFDLSYKIILMLEKLGLATNVKAVKQS